MLLEKEMPSKTQLQVDSDIDVSNLFHSFLKGIKKRLKTILIALLLGTIGGFCYYFFKKPIYTSQMMGYSETLKKEVVYSVIEDLQRLIEQNDYEQLQQFLNLSEKSVKSLVDLKARAAIEKSIYDTEESNIFIVEAKVTDLTVLDSLARAIGYFVDNNDFVKVRLEKEKKNLQYSIDKMNIEIQDLEELKVNMREAISKNTYRTNLFLSDIGYSSSKIVELYERQNELRNKLSFMFDIKILRDFVKFKKKKEPRLFISVLSFQSLAIFIIFVLYISYFDLINNVWFCTNML